MAERVAVVVCAYTLERWDDLQSAFAALAGQTRTPDEVVLVVDHNRDLYQRSVAELTRILPGLRVVESGRTRGLSGARNTGIEATGAEIVAFLDDDAVPAATWLEELVAPYCDPLVLGTGGRCRPAWPGENSPGWFPDEFLWVVGSSYVGMPTVPAEVRNVIGASMSFRREVFDLAGTFREGLGRVGKNPLGCEETELCIRVRQARPAARIVYVPSSVVSHRVSADRVELRYFLARCRAEGVSKAQVTAAVGSDAGLSSERSYVSRTLPAGVVRGIFEGLKGDAAGFLRSGAIVTGLVFTGYGYLRARLTQRTQDHSVVVSSAASPALSSP